jgi:hypothetical protein
MIYFCAQSNRRELILQSLTLNGIDYLEVLGAPGCGTQLAITFLKDARALGLTAASITISGGAAVAVSSIVPAGALDPTVVTIDLDQTGDFSTYTLTLVASPGAAGPPPGIDPQLSRVEFSFKAGCPTPADCLTTTCCPAAAVTVPDINYLAKDYGGFLQVMLDRLAVLSPATTETHAADMGVAIVEALAYAADHLSYQQDAVSTEAYIGTARSRISLRRHARLVNYPISEGANARTLVCVQVSPPTLTIPAETLFYVGVPGLPPAAQTGDAVALQLLGGSQPVFASMQECVLYHEQTEMSFYTWGDTDCCLPAGATQATLSGSLTSLQSGDLVIFQERVGPDTSQPEDADPSHRCAVRLTGATPTTDPLHDTPITSITWADADALPFPLCISSTTDSDHASQPVTDVSVALGNVVPADHGTWIDPSPETLGIVPPLPPAPDPTAGCSCGAGSSVAQPLPRFYPSLAQSPLTFSVPDSWPPVSATAFLAPGTAGALPTIEVSSSDGSMWSPQADLLGSGPAATQFVPEIEDDGTVFLRFGDDQYGAAPSPGETFFARYRIGNCSVGNIGRDTLAHAVPPNPWPHLPGDIVAVRNPLAATGGIDPEDMGHIRQFAPFSYETQQRCVTEADYGQMATQLTEGLAARGTLRWTGSWHTAFVSIDPTQLTPLALSEATTGLATLRMMGTDVAVEAAVIVGLQIALEICVDPQHFRGDVYAALMEIFISGDRCDGSTGLLNPANFSFGQTVYASPLLAAAQTVDGVLSVTLTTFTRMDAPWVDGVANGYLTMGRLDIPRCDNDPDHLDHGIFTLQMDGGK